MLLFVEHYVACPIKGQVYKECGSACPPTCGNPNPICTLCNARLDACVQQEQFLTQPRMFVFLKPSAHVHQHVHEIIVERIQKVFAQSKTLVILSFI